MGRMFGPQVEDTEPNMGHQQARCGHCGCVSRLLVSAVAGKHNPCTSRVPFTHLRGAVARSRRMISPRFLSAQPVLACVRQYQILSGGALWQ